MEPAEAEKTRKKKRMRVNEKQEVLLKLEVRPLPYYKICRPDWQYGTVPIFVSGHWRYFSKKKLTR